MNHVSGLIDMKDQSDELGFLMPQKQYRLMKIKTDLKRTSYVLKKVTLYSLFKPDISYVKI